MEKLLVCALIVVAVVAEHDEKSYKGDAHGDGYKAGPYGNGYKAAPYGNGYNGAPHGNGYQARGSRVGYGRPATHYGGYPEPGYGGRPAYGGPPGPYPVAKEEKELNVVDKLYARLATIESEVKTGSEILANLEARLSLDKKALDEVVQWTVEGAFARFDEIDQNVQENMPSAIANLNEDITKLGDLAEETAILNSDNVANQKIIGDRLNAAIELNTIQGGDIAAQVVRVSNLKDMLIQEFTNIIDDALLQVEVAKNGFQLGTVNREFEKMCETGRVTLDADDRKAEYLYQTAFPYVPQVQYSLCGYNFDMEKRPDDTYTTEPNAIGVHVTADSSKTGLTLEVFDKSFGDTALLSADVCFQVCSINPGMVADLAMP